MTSTIDPLGVKTSMGYDEAGHIKTSTGTNDGNPPTATVRTTNAYYDDAAHPADLSRSVDARGFTSTTTYDGFGDVASRTDALTNQTRYGYDTARGWLTSTVSPNGVAAGVSTGCVPPAKGCTTFGHNAWAT